MSRSAVLLASGAGVASLKATKPAAAPAVAPPTTMAAVAGRKATAAAPPRAMPTCAAGEGHVGGAMRQQRT